MENIKTNSRFADSSGEIMIIELGGHVDQSNSYQLQKMFDDIIVSGCFQIVVDFKDLYYMSSAGWGVFIGEIKRFRENGGDIKLSNMNPDIQDVFQMLEFFHILEDYATVDEAIAAFKNIDQIDLILDNESEENTIEEKEEISETQEVEDNIEISIDDSKEITSEKVKVKKGIKSGTKLRPKSSADILNFVPETSEAGKVDEEKLARDISTLTTTIEVKLHQLPLTEKIKHIIAQNPLLGARGIKKVLKHEHFGYTKVGIFQLLRLLRDMDLNTKDKRYRYYRSC